MQSNEKPCRHEYIKIFQRKLKERGRRLSSTRGYLPTGFSNKDFNYLTSGNYCFCTKCRVRLFPVRAEAKKIVGPTLEKIIEEQKSPQVLTAATDNAWVTETTDPDPSVNLDSSVDSDSSQVIEVDELQVESADDSDIVEKDTNISKEENIIEEDGDE